jgi:poly-gamma-glutamate capsule biosynthesis protein CapA/YwtB (metallophosphatase superfamily)
MPPLTPEERLRRREEKRKRVIRRRIAFFFGLIALAVTGTFAGLSLSEAGGAAAGDSTSTATTETSISTSTSTTPTTATETTTTTTATTTMPSTTTRTTTTTKTTPAKKRGPLGSGRAVTLAFGGDVHFEGIVRPKLDESPALPLKPIAPVFRKADLAMVNLETSVSYGGSPTPGKEYTFRAPPSAFRALRLGGVDVATIANNHGMDYGMSAFLDTLRYAKRYRFPLVGGGLDSARAYAPYRVTIKGQRIAVLGATQVIDTNLVSLWTAGPHKPGLASAYDMPRLVRAVKAARKTSDTVVVYLHFGEERMGCPTSLQISAARKLISAGADIVVGSHAHRLQGAGRMGKGFVDYGLGNFVWYSQNSPESITTGVLEVTVTGRRIDSYKWVPATIIGGSPTPVTGSARSAAISSWRSLRSCTRLSR